MNPLIFSLEGWGNIKILEHSKNQFIDFRMLFMARAELTGRFNKSNEQ